MIRLSLLALGLLVAAPAFAQSNNTPVGCWATVDDEDGEVKSYVRIYAEGNTLVGDIARLTQNGGRCVDCEGPYAGRILRNERILSGFTLDGDRYEGGRIINPAENKTYRAVMNIEDGSNGDRLYLRGFIGIRAFGRSQTWNRAAASNCQ
ncbi:MAG: DUF2147 domain-containing protein [Bacteroidota bacterium]